MPEYIKNLLEDIRKRPGVYFGKKSLDRLATFLSGYRCCILERDGEAPSNLPGFQEFVAERYNIQTAHHWSDIIRFFCSTEEEAFDTFFELIDELYPPQNRASC